MKIISLLNSENKIIANNFLTKFDFQNKFPSNENADIVENMLLCLGTGDIFSMTLWLK